MAVCSGLTNRKSSSQIFRKVSSFFAKPSMGIWWVLSPNKQKMYNCHLSLRPLSHTMLLTTFSNHRFMSRDFFTLVSLSFIFSPVNFSLGFNYLNAWNGLSKFGVTNLTTYQLAGQGKY